MEQTLQAPVKAAAPAYPTIRESWAALGWLVLIYWLVGLAVTIPVYAAGYFTGAAKLVLEFLFPLVGLLFTTLWLRQSTGPQRWLGSRPWQHLGRWQLCAVVALLVMAQHVLLSVLVFLHFPNWYSADFQDLISHPLLALGLGCVAAPVCEELFFRGVLLQGLLRNYRPAVAIAQSALLFGVLHFNPDQSVDAFLGGLLIGWVYYRTRSLLLCIYLHVLNNLLVFGIMHLAGWQSEQDLLQHLGPTGYVAALVAAAAVLAGGSWWLRRTAPVGSAQPGI